VFVSSRRDPRWRTVSYQTQTERLYDWLFVNDFDAWFMNAAKALRDTERALPEFIVKLHTGESVNAPSWEWPARARLGNRLLLDLSEDALVSALATKDVPFDPAVTTRLQRELELDGYVFRDGKLYATETTVFDVAETTSLIEKLATDALLPNVNVVVHHLALAETHYTEQNWDDSIGNSRKALEAILEGVARRWGVVKSNELSEASLHRPVEVRNYLERVGLLAPKEKDMVAAVYGLLSNVGGHPHIATPEEARLTRHLSLSVAEFVLRRFDADVDSKL